MYDNKYLKKMTNNYIYNTIKNKKVFLFSSRNIFKSFYLKQNLFSEINLSYQSQFNKKQVKNLAVIFFSLRKMQYQKGIINQNKEELRKINSSEIRLKSKRHLKQEIQIMHLAKIMSTFQHEEDKVEFKLFQCFSEEI